MDFFDHQEKARSKTGLLIFFFGVAVGLIVLAVYGIVAVHFRISPPVPPEQWGIGGVFKYWDPQLFLAVAGATLLLILSGSLYKIKVLGDMGGEGVAELFEGEYVRAGTDDPGKKRLLNIVEEMSIAAGMSIPRLYLMEGDSINAFAAGYSVNNAVIGVTRGCLKKLNRQELQGVVAHEFSHIINGDMKSNLRLVGLLHGILLLNIIGYTLFRAAGRGGGKSDGRVRLVFLAFGLALMVIGYLGVFFGRLIKSAVSRQREFLADASAVQYTRDPEGIYGALKKISQDGEGSRVDNPATEEVSHLFFGNALPAAGFSQLFGLLSTHPTLKKRMDRILARPSANPHEKDQDKQDNGERGGDFGFNLEGEDHPFGFAPGTSTSEFQGAGRDKLAGQFQLGDEPKNNGSWSNQEFGVLDKKAVGDAESWMTHMPAGILESLKSPEGAGALLLSILLTRMPVTGRVAEQTLLSKIPRAIWTKSQDLVLDVEKLKPEEILPLVDLAMVPIRDLPKRDLRNIYEQTLSFDSLRGQETLFDYSVSSFIRARLSEMISPGVLSDPRSGDVLRYLGSIRVVLSTLARYGHPESDIEARTSYLSAVDTLGHNHISAKAHASFRRLDSGGLLDKKDCGMQEFDVALFSLRDSSPLLKKSFLEACFACISRDTTLHPEEIELFRAIAGVLDCPVAPYLGGERGN